MAIVLDIRDNPGLEYSGRGYEITRIARVTNLTAAEAYARSQEALTAIITDLTVGPLGSAHPSLSNCYLKSVGITNEMTDVARAELVYRSRPTVRMTTDSTANQIQTFYDIAGDPIVAVVDNLRFTVDTLTNSVIGASGFEVGAILRVTTSGTLPSPLEADTNYYVREILGEGIVTLSTTRGGSEINITNEGSGFHFLGPVKWIDVPMTIPGERKTIEVELPYGSHDFQGYVMCVNAAGWSLDPDAPARTWKCMSIRDTTDDLLNYQWTVEFEYRAISAVLQTNGWKELAAYRASDGNVPYAADPSAWVRWIDVAQVIDFDGLPIYG